MDKECSRCRQTKPVESFYRNGGFRDGLHPYCKACLLAYQSASRHGKLDAVDPNRRRWTGRFVRHDYFACVDSPVKAYVLGLLAADGTVMVDPPRIALELHEKDGRLVQLVRDELAPEVRLRRRPPRRRSGPQVVFAVTSRRLVADLCDLGVTPRKSLTLRWPQMLPPEFARPYLLGYFDGDGFTTVSRSQAGYAYPRWGLLGTEAFLLRAIEVIGAGTGIRQRRPRSPTNSKIWRLTITGADAERVDEWLHNGPPAGLARKRINDPFARRGRESRGSSSPPAP